MIQVSNINVKSTLEDFLKIEYTDGLQNEFNTMEALINKLKTEQLVGKYKTKSFALGVTDNVRAVENGYDTYVLGTSDFSTGGDTVEAQYDTTKLMGIFAITDETIVKGTSDGSIFDILNDNLSRMNLSLKHTLNRYTYGSNTGKIGALTGAAVITAAGVSATGKTQAEFEMTNSLSLLPGMGILIVDGETKVQGRVWQKYNPSVGVEKLIVVLDEVVVTIASGALVYSRQLDKTKIMKEYTGLEDIMMTANNTIFGVDRSVYKTLNTPIQDLSGELLTESVLRDMADHVEITCADDSSIKTVASNHKIISSIEKQMYQYKEYSLDSAGAGFALGRKDIKFDTYTLFKDKYSRDRNVYMLDTDKIGELVRKDFGWITDGSQAGGVLSRRDGSEIYEGIMTKYADMYIDAWKSHAAFKNAAETIA